MKRKAKIPIEEQLYRAGIWERPGPKHINLVMPEQIIVVRYIDPKTGKTMRREYNGEWWGEPVIIGDLPAAHLPLMTIR